MTENASNVTHLPKKSFLNKTTLRVAAAALVATVVVVVVLKVRSGSVVEALTEIT